MGALTDKNLLVLRWLSVAKRGCLYKKAHQIQLSRGLRRSTGCTSEAYHYIPRLTCLASPEYQLQVRLLWKIKEKLSPITARTAVK